jgi:hypothetical protein
MSPSSKVEPAFLGGKQMAFFLKVSVQVPRKCRAKGTGLTWCKMEGCIPHPIGGLRKYIAETHGDFTVQDKTRPTTNNGSARHG